MINEKNKGGFVNVEFLILAEYVENKRFVKIKNVFYLQGRTIVTFQSRGIVSRIFQTFDQRPVFQASSVGPTNHLAILGSKMN